MVSVQLLERGSEPQQEHEADELDELTHRRLRSFPAEFFAVEKRAAGADRVAAGQLTPLAVFEEREVFEGSCLAVGGKWSR